MTMSTMLFPSHAISLPFNTSTLMPARTTTGHGATCTPPSGKGMQVYALALPALLLPHAGLILTSLEVRSYVFFFFSHSTIADLMSCSQHIGHACALSSNRYVFSFPFFLFPSHPNLCRQ